MVVSESGRISNPKPSTSHFVGVTFLISGFGGATTSEQIARTLIFCCESSDNNSLARLQDIWVPMEVLRGAKNGGGGKVRPGRRVEVDAVYRKVGRNSWVATKVTVLPTERGGGQHGQRRKEDK